MKRAVLIYAPAVAGVAFLLEWLEYRYTVRLFTTEIYVVALAVLFTVLGIWVGNRLTGKQAPVAFEKNEKALRTLGITEREYEVLELLAQGLSNPEIAKKLFVSLNTIKTHVARLYDKLEVKRRTQAVQKARELSLIR